jgi:hypothetical protein
MDRFVAEPVIGRAFAPLVGSLSPGAKCWSRASLLFLQHGVTLLDQPVELLLLLSNPLRCSLFILRAGESSSLFNQLSHIVLQYRDAIVEFR